MYFFFSSRRRHTRYWRDWSSDVCSSDLRRGAGVLVEHRVAGRVDPPALLVAAHAELRRDRPAVEEVEPVVLVVRVLGDAVEAAVDALHAAADVAAVGLEIGRAHV